jgi:hypothetical protein
VRTLSQLIAIAIVTSIFAHAQQPSNNPPSTLRFDNVRLHHVVERHFQHDLWLNHPPETLILNRVLQKPPRHFGDFGIGQTRIRLPDIYQSLAIPHRKRSRQAGGRAE